MTTEPDYIKGQVEDAANIALAHFHANEETSMWHMFPAHVKRDMIVAKWLRNVAAFGPRAPDTQEINRVLHIVGNMFTH